MKRIVCLLGVLTTAAHIYGANITFNVICPAEVHFDKSVEKIAIIDRSVVSKSAVNIIEGILTGEGLNQDKLASQIALDGLTNLLRNTDRFEVVRTSEIIETSKTGEQFPEALDWQEVIRLCSKYKADAIISLELFDSDYVISKGTNSELNSFFAKGVGQVHLGFRFYDPQSRSIADQFYTDYQMDWRVEKPSISDALGSLMKKNSALREVSYHAGYEYGKRISPSYRKVTREYCRKSKKDDNLAEGARMMEANDWNSAISALELAYETGHKKTRGRAAHNLAVVYEILGDLEKSKEYASIAWGRYKNKPSRDYAYLITRRMNQQSLVDSQLGMK